MAGIHVDASKLDKLPQILATGFTSVQMMPNKKAGTVECDLYIHSNHRATPFNAKGITAPFIREVRAAKESNAKGIVVHLTNSLLTIKSETSPSIPLQVKALRKIAQEARTLGLKIFLEHNASTRNFHTLEAFQHLEQLLGEDAVDFEYCIDTAHLHGGSDFKPEYLMPWLRSLDALRRPVGLIHLNGSLSSRGSGKDKHTVGGEDKNETVVEKSSTLTEDQLAIVDLPLEELGQWMRDNDVPFIIEERSQKFDDASLEVYKTILRRLGFLDQ